MRMIGVLTLFETFLLEIVVSLSRQSFLNQFILDSNMFLYSQRIKVSR